MKKIIFILTAAVLAVSVLFTSCSKTYEIKEYPQMKTDFEFDINDNLNISADREEFLKNPDRGFRGEVYITLGSCTSYGGEGDAYEKLSQELESLKDDNVGILQCYVYLSEYHDRELDEKALQQLKEYFTELKSRNIRILIRFAYEYDQALKMGPGTETIENHCKQLKEFFLENIDLYNSVVYGAQLGMIGLWGEGHTNSKRLNFYKVVEAVSDMYPEETVIMMRLPDFYKYIPEDEDDTRYTVHDDFIVGVSHEWGTIPFDHAQYGAMLTKNQYNLCDGEMPWGRDSTVQNIDGKAVLKQIAGYGFTSFSLTHNYKDGTAYLNKWKDLYVTEQELFEMGAACNPEYLENGRISVFDYLKYHLGYHLAVSNFEESGGKISFLINNFGLAAPHEFKLYYVISGKEIEDENFDKMSLSRFGQYKVSADAENLESFGIVFRHRRDESLTIKLSNDLPYENGINYIVYNTEGTAEN